MPEYEIDDNAKTVSFTIYGIASDDAYTDLLKSDSTLSLTECLWLDAVRTHRPITKEAARHLKDKKLIAKLLDIISHCPWLRKPSNYPVILALSALNAIR